MKLEESLHAAIKVPTVEYSRHTVAVHVLNGRDRGRFPMRYTRLPVARSGKQRIPHLQWCEILGKDRISEINENHGFIIYIQSNWLGRMYII